MSIRKAEGNKKGRNEEKNNRIKIPKEKQRERRQRERQKKIHRNVRREAEQR